MFSLLQIIPKWLWDVITCLLITLAFVFAALIYGHHEYERGIMAVKIIDQQEVSKVTVESSRITSLIVPPLVSRVAYVQGAVRTITKEVPIYVTKKDDAACPIPNGFVWLWNETNKMQLPYSSSTIPSGASSVVLSDIAAEHAREAGIASKNEATLIAMQKWLKEQQAVYGK